MGKKMMCLTAVLGIICLLLLCGYRYRVYENRQQKQAMAAMQEDAMRSVIQPYVKLSYANKYLYDVDLGNKTKENIEKILQEYLSQYGKRSIQIYIQDKVFTYPMKQFSEQFFFRTGDGQKFTDSAKLADYIVNLQKDEDLESQYAIVQGKKQPDTLHVEVEHNYDDSAVQTICDTLYKLHYTAGMNAVMGQNMSITKSKDGTFLQTENIKKKIQKYLASDAAESLELRCKLSKLKPQWTTKKLEKCKTVIGEFTTRFSPYGNRGGNVSLGASRINGIFLYPGEEVSFDKLLHDNSDGRHFGSAPSYLNGRSVMTAGGGICQVSSTSYNALLRAGILPTKRFNHSMAVSYVPMGLDATISEGVKDMVVENTTDYPIYISAKTSGGTLQVQVHSDIRAKEGYTYEPRAVRLSQYRASAYLDKYKNGKKVESLYLHTDTYLPHH